MKKNPIVIAIIVLLIVLVVIIALYLSSENSTSAELNTTNESSTYATIQTIENTLSSSGQISSALDEKLSLHASYYFEKILVDKDVYIEEGTNIIEYTNGVYLKAPYDCVLTSYNLPNEGEICTTSHYIEIQSIDSLCMNLSVSESDINKVEIGDIVDITVTSTNEKIEGRITSLSEIGTYSSNGSYFTAKVSFENTGSLKIGMSATCEIILERAENVIAVPLEAIQTSDEGKYVIVINKDGSQENVNVETGISNDAYIEIKSGISENTQVVMAETTSTSNSNSNRGFNSNGSFNGRGNSGNGMPNMPNEGNRPNK